MPNASYKVSLDEVQYKDLKTFLEQAHLRAFEIPRFLQLVERIKAADKVFDSTDPQPHTAV